MKSFPAFHLNEKKYTPPSVLQNGTLESLRIGENILQLEVAGLTYGSAYIVTLKTASETASLRVIVTE